MGLGEDLQRARYSIVFVLLDLIVIDYSVISITASLWCNTISQERQRLVCGAIQYLG